MKKKAFFIIFKRFSAAKDSVRPESAPSTLLRKLNILKNLSQNIVIVFNLIRFFVRPQLFNRSARCHGLFIGIAMEAAIRNCEGKIVFL